MNLQVFYSSSPRQQAKQFPKIKLEIEGIVRAVLWAEFKKRNLTLVSECTSFIFEKLNDHHHRIVAGKERPFLYSIGKRYFQEWFFERNSRTVFIEDLLSDDEKNTDRLPILEAEEMTDDLESLKLEAIDKFQQLIQSTNDKSSLLLICAIVECVLTQYDYNAQILSLFLYRKTGLKYDVMFRTLKSLNLRFPLSHIDWFNKIFNMYSQIEPRNIDSNIISDWEKRAIVHFESRHDRFKGTNYETRHNRITEKVKVKSTPLERVYWMKVYKGQSMESDYYKKFDRSFSTFKSDKRMAFN